ncbi:MAG TPA: ribosome maturation factor RimP [Polyangiaceae bacterium]|nr:ribosome maturation factor RimP [Polyangiaceae bacterium]
MPGTAPTIHGIDRDALMRVIDPVARAHGVDVVEVTFKPERGGWVLRVAIEVAGSTEPGGGVTIDRCADLSRDLSTALDVADVVRQAYSLEVSSPGVERPLRTAAEFERFRGQRAKVVLSEPGPDGQFAYDGAIARVEGERLWLATGSGGEVELPIGSVKRAHLVFEFGPAPKPGPKGRQQQQAAGGKAGRPGRPGRPNTRSGE